MCLVVITCSYVIHIFQNEMVSIQSFTLHIIIIRYKMPFSVMTKLPTNNIELSMPCLKNNGNNA